ncbi:MAG: hypothetical protein HYV33_02655 [Candidatus Kerfeldbacteria bacterium]|nr:hypothetical protein [Candidatus Kerfeldbacteria bacterium]
MRQIISLSLPTKQAVIMRKLTAQRGYKNVSQYITSLITMDADLISEAELIQSVKHARAEYKKGKVIKAKSLDELL